VLDRKNEFEKFDQKILPIYISSFYFYFFFLNFIQSYSRLYKTKKKKNYKISGFVKGVGNILPTRSLINEALAAEN